MVLGLDRSGEGIDLSSLRELSNVSPSPVSSKVDSCGGGEPLGGSGNKSCRDRTVGPLTDRVLGSGKCLLSNVEIGLVRVGSVLPAANEGFANELGMGSPDSPDGPEGRAVASAPPLISLLFSFLSKIDIFLNNFLTVDLLVFFCLNTSNEKYLDNNDNLCS